MQAAAEKVVAIQAAAVKAAAKQAEAEEAEHTEKRLDLGCSLNETNDVLAHLLRRQTTFWAQQNCR